MDGTLTERPARESTKLLLDLAEALHAAASPADVAEARLRGVAGALGLDAQFFTLQSFFATELRRGDEERVEIRRIPFDTHWNLREVASLDELCRAITERRLDAAGARRELDRIVATRSVYPKALVAVAWGVYGGAVAIRVGGRWIEGLAGILIGLAAGSIHFLSAQRKPVNLEKTFLGAFLGSIVAFILALVLPPFDYPRALFGGISLLIPAMVVTIGIHELANEELESGTVRLVYGLMCFGLLGAGITAAFVGGKFLGLQPHHLTATRLPDLVVLACVALGGLALVVCLEGRPRDVGWIVAAAVIAYGAQELTRLPLGDEGAPIVVAFVLGSAAYLYARRPGRVPFTMLVPGLLQLAPGFLGTKATFKLLSVDQPISSGGSYFGVILLALQLGIGILVSGLLFKHLRRRARTAARVTAAVR
ncbi:MAG TPA: threonine/serine exporter family protein [Polyangia bacterium]|nr:threonine/serine exporter family protein [Polyangia bacterium]